MSSDARLRADPDIIDQFQAWIVASGPGYVLDIPFAELATASTLGLWLALGLIVTAVLGVLPYWMGPRHAKATTPDALCASQGAHGRNSWRAAPSAK